MKHWNLLFSLCRRLSIFVCSSTPDISAMPRLCCGRDGEPCVFSTSRARQRAQAKGQAAFCRLCDLELLEESLGKAASKGQLLGQLRTLRALDEGVFDLALARIGEVSPHVEEIERLAGAPQLSVEDQWRACLKKRKRLRASPSREERRSFRKKVEKDRTRVRLKFFPEKHRRIPHSGHLWRHRMTQSVQAHVRDAATNDTGLPAAHLTNNAAMVEKWCKWGSWTICPTCHSVQPRHMKNIDARRLAGPHHALRDCRACKAAGGRNSGVATVAAVPRALRKLNTRIVKALRPLDVDCGPVQRAPQGYRIHTGMIRFSWSADCVTDKIRALERDAERTKALEAYDFLMQHEGSAYGTFVERRQEFLQRHPNPTAAELRRPLQFIEQLGLECALWPDLYTDLTACETYERATDTRRQQRNPDMDDAESEDSSQPIGRHSLKRSFLLKALGPVLDYAADYELLQFVFDLSVWSDLGGKRNVRQDVPMRILLKGCPFVPSYWAVRHAALLDLQRQGLRPLVFKTWAPYEWRWPQLLFASPWKLVVWHLADLYLRLGVLRIMAGSCTTCATCIVTDSTWRARRRSILPIC